jgi:hypothetical protein
MEDYDSPMDIISCFVSLPDDQPTFLQMNTTGIHRKLYTSKLYRSKYMAY